MMGSKQPLHILPRGPFFNEKLVNWRREQPRDSPDQQDKAQGYHGCH